MNFLASTVGKIIAALVLVVIVLGGLQFCSWQRARQQAAESRLQRNQTEALSNSAQDAIATQGRSQAEERASEELSRSNEKEIRDAEGANDRVNPAVRDAGLRSLCRRAAYRDSERCRVFNAGPAGVEGRR